MFHNINLLFCGILLSLPSRERGLKYRQWYCIREEKGRSLRGSVDWNLKWNSIKHLNKRSFPSRERGLKFPVVPGLVDLHRSLPSRERGLKYRSRVHKGTPAPSLPSRERGLKFRKSLPCSCTHCRSIQWQVSKSIEFIEKNTWLYGEGEHTLNRNFYDYL